MVLDKFNTFYILTIEALTENSFLTKLLTKSVLVYILGIFLTVALIYVVFYVPFNWSKGLDDVSYSLALRTEGKLNSSRKKDAINRLRRTRNKGSNELPPPYPNGWYGILESAKLSAGEATSVACLGEQFVVYRTLENKVFILDAYCPHLGANLGVGGKVIGNNIECPFHQWSFSGVDGKCTNIPYSTCVPQGTSLRKWISREVNGFIFVWYHVENEEPWQLPSINEIDSNEFVFHGRNEFYVNCHIQEIPENGADIAHFNAIHKDSIFGGSVNPSKNLLSNAGNHLWQATWNPSSDDKHRASVYIKHCIQLTSKFQCFPMDITGHQIGPAYVQLHLNSISMGQIVILQTITPIEPLVQKVVHRFYARRILAPMMKFAIFGESIMFERDMKMWNHKVFRGNPKLVKEDAPVKLFRNWFGQFFTPNSKTFSEAHTHLDW